MTILDLFSGIGGFSQGLIQAGFKLKKHFFAEVDTHAQAIYKYKFPQAEPVGDVRHVRGAELGQVDIITFGSPCQDFSLAGKRRGMDGERSSLITEAIRLIDECRPDFFIWENVKGTFSSNGGEDFAAIIQAFANIGGYRLEWQLLNTAWFLPQNRERIYLVGRIAERCRGQVFPIEKNNRRIDERAEQATNARTLTAGGNSGGLHRIQSYGRNEKQKIRKKENLKVSNCLTSRYYKDAKENMLKVGAIRGRNPENPKSRVAGLPTEQMFEENEKGIANTLTSVQKDTVIAGISMERTEQGKRLRKKYESGELKHGFNEHRIEKVRTDGLSNCIDTNIKSQKVGNNDFIRRLTEIECERLQGFEDDWTKLGNYNGEIKEVSATQRYKCLGNAVTVDVVQAVGEAIMESTY